MTFCELEYGAKGGVVFCPKELAEIFDMAVQQSVVGVTFEALQTLLKDCMPVQKLLLKWISNVCAIEKLNKQVNEAVDQLVSYLNVYSIPCRLMKGQGCASLYPNPLYRQSGDIDLFVGEIQYERAKNQVRARGVDIERESTHDAHFTWGKVLVEMHKLEMKLY